VPDLGFGRYAGLSELVRVGLARELGVAIAAAVAAFFIWFPIDHRPMCSVPLTGEYSPACYGGPISVAWFTQAIVAAEVAFVLVLFVGWFLVRWQRF
jgi:hypothetical protein